MFLLDDDIIISREGIERLFRYQEQYDLDAVQPCRTDRKGISCWVTGCYRYPNKGGILKTNFVEVGTPLFKLSSILDFFENSGYASCGESNEDPCLGSWGLDFWYMQYFGALDWTKNSDAKAATAFDVFAENPPSTKSWEKITNDGPARWAAAKSRFNLVEFDEGLFGETVALGVGKANLGKPGHSIGKLESLNLLKA